MTWLDIPYLKIERHNNVYREDYEIPLLIDNNFKYDKDKLSIVINEIKKRFGVGGLAFLYYISKIMGEYSVINTYSEKNDELDILVRTLEYSGIGKIESVTRKNSQITILLSRCIEMKYSKNGDTNSQYVFTKGFIEGLVSRIISEKNYVTFTKKKEYLKIDIFFLE